MPPYKELLWPTVLAMRDLGDSGSIDEIDERVLELGDYSEAQQAALHGNGPGTEIAYRLAWARSYLKGMGLAENSQRGVWSLTTEGRAVTEPGIEPLRQKYLAVTRKRKADEEAIEQALGPAPEDSSPDETWQNQLLDVVMTMEPAAFE